MTTEDIYIATQNLLTDIERATFLKRVTALNPHLQGADVADVLGMMDDADACLGLVEPAYTQLKDKVKRPNLIGPAAIVVAHLHTSGSPEDVAYEHPARMVVLIGEIRQILAR